MRSQHLESVHRYAKDNQISIEKACRRLALARCQKPDAKKSSTPFEIVAVQKRSDFTLAMVNYNTKHSQEAFDPQVMIQNAKLIREGKKEDKGLPKYWDLTAYIVYDHRSFKPLEDLAERVINTVLDDSVFM